VKIQISISDDAEENVNVEQVEGSGSTAQTVASPTESDVIGAPPQFAPVGQSGTAPNGDGESAIDPDAPTGTPTPDQIGDVIPAPSQFREEGTNTQ